MPVVGRLTGFGTFLAYDFDEISQNKVTISGVGTAFAYEFDENQITVLTGSTRMRYLPNVGIGTTVVVYDSIDEISQITTAVPTTGLQLNIDPAASTVTETLPVGQQEYTTAGTYTFTVPNGCTSISAVVVGGGGGGAGCDGGQVRGETNNGGGGGGLAYGTIAVTPGETLTVVVGNGGNAGGDDGNGGAGISSDITGTATHYGGGGGGGNTSLSGEFPGTGGVGGGGNGGSLNSGGQNGTNGLDGGAGGNTTIVISGTTLLSGGGGAGGQYRSEGATSAGGASGGTARIGGGSGGNSGTGSGVSGATGGGGAGGYSGNGGNGGARNAGGSAGAGGGAGGGGGFDGTSNTLRAGGGGGVGIRGTGSNGSAGVINGGGGGGGSSLTSVTEGTSGGGNTSGLGGTYGGGGGGKADAFSNTATPNGGAGTGGAVRIVWGTGRSYPSTGLTNYTTVNYSLSLSDLSGNGRTATSINGASYSSALNSGVVVYDGTDDYMTLASYKGVTGTAARTSIIWFKSIRIDNYIRLLGWGNPITAGNKWSMIIDSTTYKLRVELAGGAFVLGGATTPNLTDGKWHVVAASAPASGTCNDIKLYVDGDLLTDVSRGLSATAINTSSGSDVSFGASLADVSPQYLNGHTSQFLIYNVQLGDFDIKEIYRRILSRF